MPYSMVVAFKGSKVEIGEGGTVSMFSRIGCKGYIKIGSYVEMGSNVFIADFNHAYEDVSKPVKLQGVRWIPRDYGSPNIEIGDGSWIGTNVTLIGNARIGKHCIIGANSEYIRILPIIVLLLARLQG